MLRIHVIAIILLYILNCIFKNIIINLRKMFFFFNKDFKIIIDVAYEITFQIEIF